MVNPSDADEEIDDPTIRKVDGFTRRLGFGRATVVNEFAFRSKDVAALRLATDPVGPENDLYIEQVMREASLFIVGWGSLAKLPPHLRHRWREFCAIADRVGIELYCFGTCADGHPRHPCMTGYKTPLTPWTRPA